MVKKMKIIAVLKKRTISSARQHIYIFKELFRDNLIFKITKADLSLYQA